MLIEKKCLWAMLMNFDFDAVCTVVGYEIKESRGCQDCERFETTDYFGHRLEIICHIKT